MKKCFGAREEMNKESTNINEPLLFIDRVHVCLHSRRHCIETWFFCSRQKPLCMKTTDLCKIISLN